MIPFGRRKNRDSISGIEQIMIVFLEIDKYWNDFNVTEKTKLSRKRNKVFFFTIHVNLKLL